MHHNYSIYCIIIQVSLCKCYLKKSSARICMHGFSVYNLLYQECMKMVVSRAVLLVVYSVCMHAICAALDRG